MDPGRRVLDLLRELDVYRARYGDVSVPDEVEVMNLAIARRARRVEAIRGQIRELLDELDRLDGEIEGCQKGYEALLNDTLDRIRLDHREGWSPIPVTGYRLWEWRAGGLYGAWEQWKTVTKEARCRHPGDLPHSNGVCGRLGCGVYAAKALAPLLGSRIGPGTVGYAAGLVELTGKVVEHEGGYRAARAEATGLVLVGPEGMGHTQDAALLDLAFKDPDRAYAQLPRSERRPDPTAQLLDLFERRKTTWTSETRNG